MIVRELIGGIYFGNQEKMMDLKHLIQWFIQNQK